MPLKAPRAFLQPVPAVSLWQDGGGRSKKGLGVGARVGSSDLEEEGKEHKMGQETGFQKLSGPLFLKGMQNMSIPPHTHLFLNEKLSTDDPRASACFSSACCLSKRAVVYVKVK